LGHRQARETGTFLESLFTEEGIPAENITWLSSPFVRCIQTSDTALNAFTTMDTHNIQIKPEYSVFEMDGHDGALHASLPPIEERYHYFPRIDVTHESLFVPPLPETREGLLPRCEKAMQIFNQRYPYKPKTAIVIVSHAASCIGLAKAASQLPLDSIQAAAPCSIFQLTRTSNTDVWQIDPHDQEGSMNGSVVHISEVGKSTKIWNHFYDKAVNIGWSGPPDSPYAPQNLSNEDICDLKEGRGTAD